MVASPSVVRPTSEAVQSGSSPDSVSVGSSGQQANREGSRKPSGVLPSRLACIKTGLRKSGYSSSVANAIATSHRKTTRKLYDFQWQAFASFGVQHGFVPAEASIPQVAEYLVYLRNTRHLKASSINTNMSAILSVLRKRSPGLDISVLKSLVKTFRSADGRQKLRPPEWDLAVVLNHLRSERYEPLTEAPLLPLTIKTIFLVAMASSARISEIHALQADLLRFEVKEGGSALLGLAPEFVCKNQAADEAGRTFSIPALGSDSGELDLFLCPVRALRIYAERTSKLRDGRRHLFLPHSPRCSKEIDKRALGV